MLDKWNDELYNDAAALAGTNVDPTCKNRSRLELRRRRPRDPPDVMLESGFSDVLHPAMVVGKGSDGGNDGTWDEVNETPPTGVGGAKPWTGTQTDRRIGAHFELRRMKSVRTHQAGGLHLGPVTSAHTTTSAQAERVQRARAHLEIRRVKASAYPEVDGLHEVELDIPETTGHVHTLPSHATPPKKKKHRSHIELRRTPAKRSPTEVAVQSRDVQWSDRMPSLRVPCVLMDSSHEQATQDSSPTGSVDISSSPVESETDDVQSAIASTGLVRAAGLSAAARIQMRRAQKEAEARQRMGIVEKRREFEGAEIGGVSPAYLNILQRANGSAGSGEGAATSVAAFEPVLSTPDQARARSEAALARARARNRSNVVQMGDLSTSKSSESQQDWLASALNAVSAEEKRADQPVNVQLDWLSVAILNQSSFDESSNGDTSPPVTPARRSCANLLSTQFSTPQALMSTPRSASRSIASIFTTKSIQL